MLLQSWYDFPRFYDIAFRSETEPEADFIEAACRKYCRFPVHRLLEPGCGTGRLVVELARRGYAVAGYDLNRKALSYLRRRLSRCRLQADVFEGDMTGCRLPVAADAAFCTFNTFRHLLTEDAARSHLEAMATSVRPGGIYLLGFHLLPPDADLECTERWTERHRGTQVTVTLRVLQADRRRRIERLRISVLARHKGREIRMRDEFPLRMYTAAQFQRLLAGVPCWKLADVYDFWYEIDTPLTLDNSLSDTLFVLQRR